MMSILLTGFTSFHGVKVNPSQMIVEQIEQDDVIARVLPVEYELGGKEITRLIHEVNPDAVVCLGVASGRSAINLERIALNLNDDHIPDNAGVIRSGQPIVPDAPLAYASTLPLDAMYNALESRKIPVTISNHAGAYLCNHVFYTARHMVETRNIPCGFIHIPKLKVKKGKGLPLETMIEAVELCLDVVRERCAAHVG